jgi:hypothetical protein
MVAIQSAELLTLILGLPVVAVLVFVGFLLVARRQTVRRPGHEGEFEHAHYAKNAPYRWFRLARSRPPYSGRSK